MRCWDGPLWNGVNTDYGESGIYREDFLKYIKPMTPEEAIAILWDYHHVKQELRPAELIFILGSNDIRVAEYAAELYARKLAPLLLFSGGMGRFTGEWAVPEAELFAEEAMKKGVPGDCILIENKSTNTGENVRFSRAVLKKPASRNHPASSPFKSPIWNGARWLRSRPSGRKYGWRSAPLLSRSGNI